jgi:cell division protein ZapE
MHHQLFLCLRGQYLGVMTQTMHDLYEAAVTAGSITPDPAQRALLDEFESLLDYLALPRPVGLRAIFAKEPDAPKGLYLWGGVGRGKSMMMDMFYSAAQGPKRRVHFHAFMLEIHAGLHEARKTEVQDALLPVAQAISDQVRLLAFDEMQITDITDAMLVGRLFEHLLSAGVVIITTSNRAPDTLYENGLNRQLFLPFIELLKHRMHIHHLCSPTDHRQNKLARSELYFHPANAAAKGVIDGIWDDISGGTSQPLTLHVKGRAIELPAYSNGVARMDFWELCGKPLGAADYLAIVAAIRVLILENVPLLSRSNFNEARRFVTLIDTLYEAKTRTVISAADIPDRLYLEGEGSFEFERTASRLIEMQSHDWGG